MKTTKEKITHYTTEDEQVEAMVNGQSDAIFDDSIAAEAVKGGCLVVTLISAVVVTVRVMGGVD